MQAKLTGAAHYGVLLAGAAMLVSWAIALGQALPRLMAGPLCTSQQDAWALAGHCPACFAAVGFTLVFVTGLALQHRRARAVARVAA